jgi:hypothetical protein
MATSVVFSVDPTAEKIYVTENISHNRPHSPVSAT